MRTYLEQQELPQFLGHCHVRSSPDGTVLGPHAEPSFAKGPLAACVGRLVNAENRAVACMQPDWYSTVEVGLSEGVSKGANPFVSQVAGEERGASMQLPWLVMASR